MKAMPTRVEEFIADPRRALISLSLPLAVAMFVQTMYNIVDAAFVGRLGAESIAALSFSFPLFFILVALTQGLGAGLNSTISRFLGAGRLEEAENAAGNGILLSLALAVAVLVLGLVTVRPLFALFGAPPGVAELGRQYMSIIFLGTAVMFPSFALNSIFSAQGDTRTPMKVQVTGLVLNAVLDPIFIYPLGFGVAGAAIATDISLAVTLVLYVIFLRRKSVLRLRSAAFRASWPLCGEILRVGVPAALMMILLSIYVMFLNGYMIHFGTPYVAAFGLVTRLESFASLPIGALSVALLTLVGMFYGAKRYDLLRKLSRDGLLAGIALTSAIGLIMFAVPSIFLAIFTTEKDILRLGSAYLRVDVFTFPLMSTTMIISRVLQGLGLGTPGLVITLIRVFIVVVPLSYVFVFIFGLGFLWVAGAMIVGGLVSNLVGYIWMKRAIDRLCPETDGRTRASV